jgi:hypothetical protein
LDRKGILLHLPACIACAVIGNGQFVAHLTGNCTGKWTRKQRAFGP